MKYFACCLLLGWGLVSKGQNIWNKTFIEDRPTMRFSGVVVSDTGYNIIGVTVNKQSPYYEQALTVKVDTNGNLINYKSAPDTVGLNTGPFWNALIRTNTGEFAFTGYGADTAQHLIFGFLNESFDSMRIFRYHTPNTFAFQGMKLVQYDNNTYYVTGVHTENLPGKSNVVLVKIDSSGNRIWEKYYDTGKYDHARSICKLDNDNLLIGAEKNDQHQTNENAHTWLIEVDTGGSVVRQWFDPNDSTYVAEGLLQTRDGGFIYGAQKKNYQSGFSLTSFNATVVKLDSNFSKQWTFIRGGNDLSIYTGINDIEQLPDGNFLIAGNLSYYGTDTALNGYVAKLDIGGNVVWERNYRGINASQTLNFLTDIDVLADGSLIAIGMTQDNTQTPSQFGWILKLDSNGCEIENCLVSVGEKLTLPEIIWLKVYPNPATDLVRFDYNWLEWESISDCELRIADMNGRIVLSQKVPKYSTRQDINIKELAEGLYTVSIQSGQRQLAVCKLTKQ